MSLKHIITRKIIYNQNILAYSLPGVFLSGIYYIMLNKGDSTMPIKKSEYVFKLMGTIIWWPSDIFACLFGCSNREERLWKFKYDVDNNLKLELNNKVPNISTRTILSNYNKTLEVDGPDYLGKIVCMKLDKNQTHPKDVSDIQKAISVSFFQEFRRFAYLWKTNTSQENLIMSIGGVAVLLYSSLLMRRPILKTGNINLPWTILLPNMINLTHTALSWPGNKHIPKNIYEMDA